MKFTLNRAGPGKSQLGPNSMTYMITNSAFTFFYIWNVEGGNWEGFERFLI